VPAALSHNEKELLQSLAEGNEAAFAKLYETYAPALIGFVAARVSSLEDARDLIHDLFIYLWEERANIVITSSIQPFLFAAARYRIIDHFRRNSTRREYAVKLQLLQASLSTDAENMLDEKDLRLTIEQAVDQLSPRVKEIYRLSRDQHRTIREIADELQLSQQTVRNQLATALSHLRSFLDKLQSLFW